MKRKASPDILEVDFAFHQACTKMHPKPREMKM